MSDSIKGAIAEVSRDIKDSVGEMIEQSVQSITAPQLTPQQIQQKQMQDQKDLAEARRKIQWFKNLTAAQKKVRDQEKQKQMQKREPEAEAQKKQVVITPAGKRQPGTPIREDIARSRQEIGKGHGVGG